MIHRRPVVRAAEPSPPYGIHDCPAPLVPQSANAMAGFESRLARRRTELMSHPLYELVNDRPTLQVFMQSHVFAV